jgi:hypothetical protein
MTLLRHHRRLYWQFQRYHLRFRQLVLMLLLRHRQFHLRHLFLVRYRYRHHRHHKLLMNLILTM